MYPLFSFLISFLALKPCYASFDGPAMVHYSPRILNEKAKPIRAAIAREDQNYFQKSRLAAQAQVFEEHNQEVLELRKYNPNVGTLQEIPPQMRHAQEYIAMNNGRINSGNHFCHSKDIYNHLYDSFEKHCKLDEPLSKCGINNGRFIALLKEKEAKWLEESDRLKKANASKKLDGDERLDVDGALTRIVSIRDELVQFLGDSKKSLMTCEQSLDAASSSCADAYDDVLNRLGQNIVPGVCTLANFDSEIRHFHESMDESNPDSKLYDFNLVVQNLSNVRDSARKIADLTFKINSALQAWEQTGRTPVIQAPAPNIRRAKVGGR